MSASSSIACVVVSLVPVEAQRSNIFFSNLLFFFNDTATTEIYTLSLHDALPIYKGQSSGLVQKVKQLLIDDDQDCIWMRVEVAGSGASCHVGYRSCFYRSIPLGKDVVSSEQPLKLTFTETEKTFDPRTVYGDAPNPTQL